MTFYIAKSITPIYFSTLPWLKKKNQNKTYKTPDHITIAALNIGLQMPFRFSSPTDEAFLSQKFYSDPENKAFFESVFFFPSSKANSFQGTACIKSKAAGEKAV